MNLHGLVRGAISAVHPDITVTLYRSSGQVTLEDGSVKSVYAPGVSVNAQKQSAGPETLFHRDMVSDTEITDKFYLFADHDPARRAAGIYRPLSRGGDMIQLEDGTWWLVNEVLEDFSLSGWVSVLATLQVVPPDFSHSEWSTP